MRWRAFLGRREVPVPWDPDDEMGPAWGRSPPGWRAGAEALGWGSLWTQEGRTVGSQRVMGAGWGGSCMCWRDVVNRTSSSEKWFYPARSGQALERLS